jgi:hypothetical protein
VSKITDSARLETCALRLPGVCNYNRETTVWAHSNEIDGGKAKGKKLLRYDHIGAYACYACHMVLDGQAKRPEALTLDFVRRAFVLAMEESAAKLKAKGLWPSDDVLGSKPVTVQKIVKKVTTAATRAIVKKVVSVEERANEKSREPVRAGRGFPSRKTANNVGSTRIVAGPSGKENAKPSKWPKGRKLVSGNRLQSRPFGSR